MSTNARVGDQNLYGPGSSVQITYERGNLRPVAMPMGRNQTVVNPGGSNGNNLPMDFNVESLRGKVNNQNLYVWLSISPRQVKLSPWRD